MAVTRAIQLRTEIPGPRSREITERKERVVADPLGLYLPKGSTLKLIIAGTDFVRPGSTPPFQGVAWFTHNDPTDRPKEIFDSTNTIHTGEARQSYLLLPVLS